MRELLKVLSAIIERSEPGHPGVAAVHELLSYPLHSEKKSGAELVCAVSLMKVTTSIPNLTDEENRPIVAFADPESRIRDFRLHDPLAAADHHVTTAGMEYLGAAGADADDRSSAKDLLCSHDCSWVGLLGANVDAHRSVHVELLATRLAVDGCGPFIPHRRRGVETHLGEEVAVRTLQLELAFGCRADRRRETGSALGALVAGIAHPRCATRFVLASARCSPTVFGGSINPRRRHKTGSRGKVR